MSNFRGNVTFAVATIIILVCLSSAGYSQSPVDKGTFEISGSTNLGSEYIYSKYGRSFLFNFNPALDYYFLNNFHAGLGVGLNISRMLRENSPDTTSVYFLPSLSIGYTFELSKKLFFDISPHIGISLTHYAGRYHTENTNKYIYTGCRFLFKYDLGGALLNFGINSTYSDLLNESFHASYSVHSIIGLSVYF